MFVAHDQRFPRHNSTHILENVCTIGFGSPSVAVSFSIPPRFISIQHLILRTDHRIPGTKQMPNLKKLNLRHNFIKPPWKAIRHAKKLEVLDLQENVLNWSNHEYIMELESLRPLQRLRVLDLAGNPFIRNTPDYYLHALKMINQAQAGMKQSLQGFKIERIDQYEVTKALEERAKLVGRAPGTRAISKKRPAAQASLDLELYDDLGDERASISTVGLM